MDWKNNLDKEISLQSPYFEYARRRIFERARRVGDGIKVAWAQMKEHFMKIFSYAPRAHSASRDWIVISGEKFRNFLANLIESPVDTRARTIRLQSGKSIK